MPMTVVPGAMLNDMGRLSTYAAAVPLETTVPFEQYTFQGAEMVVCVVAVMLSGYPGAIANSNKGPEYIDELNSDAFGT